MTIWGKKWVAQIPNWPKTCVMDRSFDPGRSLVFFSFSAGNQELLDAPVIVCQLLVTSPAGRLCKGHTLLSVVGDTWEATPPVDSLCVGMCGVCVECVTFSFLSCVHSHFYLACYQSPTCPATPLFVPHSVHGPQFLVCHFWWNYWVAIGNFLPPSRTLKGPVPF